jgi:hypothetical protein
VEKTTLLGALIYILLTNRIQNQKNEMVWHVACVSEEKRRWVRFGWEARGKETTYKT